MSIETFLQTFGLPITVLVVFYYAIVSERLMTGAAHLREVKSCNDAWQRVVDVKDKQISDLVYQRNIVLQLGSKQSDIVKGLLPIAEQAVVQK
jgi:hypothetical protein